MIWKSRDLRVDRLRANALIDHSISIWKFSADVVGGDDRDVTKKRRETVVLDVRDQLEDATQTSILHVVNMPEDVRKSQILSTIANSFGIDQDALQSVADHRALGNFLDDANCPLLSATRTHKNSVDLSNEVNESLISLSLGLQRFVRRSESSKAFNALFNSNFVPM